MSRFQFLTSLMMLALTESLEWIHNDSYTEFTRYIAYKDSNGDIKYLDLTTESDTIAEFRGESPGSERYMLFTRNNPSSAQILKTYARSSIRSSYFNPKVPTVVTAHGWLGDKDSGVNTAIRKALLATSDVNVIVFDWHKAASDEYISCTLDVPSIGRRLGKFLTVLSSVTGAPFNSMHLVGHSLGAHVVGNAGRQVGGKVARVTGLDPAGPLWGVNANRLRSTDGLYVEVIHTNGGVLGMTSAIGDTDFYPNAGLSQLGCYTNTCSHARSWQLFASSLTYNKFIGYECNSTQFTSTKDCLHMGNNILMKNGIGIYCLQTTASYPYFL